MKDRADFARKGIARGRSVVVLSYADGILFVAENPSRALHKISEIYDRIAFAAVGKYNEFENLRVAGVRLRRPARLLLRPRATSPAAAWPTPTRRPWARSSPPEQKPYEVELVVAEVGDEPRTRTRSTGSPTTARSPTSTASSLMGGAGRADQHLPERALPRGAGLAEALALAVEAARRATERQPSRARRRPARGGGARPHPARRAFRRSPGSCSSGCSTPTTRPADAAARRARDRSGPATGDDGADRRRRAASPASQQRRRPSARTLRVTGAAGSAIEWRAWTGGSSGSRTSTASPARSRGSAGCRRTRWPATCSARSCRWGRSATSSCATGPGSTSTSARHPEYATPECDDVASSSRTTRRGSGSSRACVVDAERRLREEGIAGDVYLFKNNTDSAGNSYGCHENYLVSRHGEFGRLADMLIPFLVTRQLICGAGKVLQTPRGAVYCLSQRADHIWEGVSSATTRSPADHQHPRRAARRRRALPPPARHRRRLEHERDHHDAQGRLHRPRAAHDRGRRGHARPAPWRTRSAPSARSSHDITGRRRVRLANGREVSALEIQREYLDQGHATSSTRAGSHTDVAERVLDLWDRTLTADRERRPRPRRPRDRLGHQVEAHRALPRQARPDAGLAPDRPDRPAPTTTSTAAAGCTTCSQRAGRRPGHRRPGIFEAKSRAAADHPREAARRLHPRAPRSAAGTSPSTGCTSSSTTRPSAPCCARTRSAPWTSGSSGSSRACEGSCRPE